MIFLHLRDLNADLVAAWREAFADLGNVEVSQGDILELEADAIVSPANSFGDMDGGIDLTYARHFGHEIEGRLQEQINQHHHGELPVGQALVLATQHKAIPYMVSAPTMRVPSSIPRTVNVYLAMRAALIAVQEHNKRSVRTIESLLVPGLGTGIGEMPPGRRNVGAIWGEHGDMLA
jgi:O-acetyl-ADP-ribose deacetylase (regulator of RNase III)